MRTPGSGATPASGSAFTDSADIEGLTDELTAAADEGTLPPALDVEQVWLDAGAGLQLLDFRLGGPTPPATDGDPRQRAGELVRAVGVTALEGKPRSDGPTRVRAPLPGHASELLAQLFQPRDGTNGDLKAWRKQLGDLRSTHGATGLDELAAEVVAGRTDPYAAADRLVAGLTT